tara:strand:- start:5677 stop:6384 length:708 start_codon:yes stop_codon:yes gene_type:complete
MIVLFDADSLVWSSCYGVDSFDEACGKFDQVLMHILNEIEEVYPVEQLLVFNNSKGNFRKVLDPNYKANRNKTTPIPEYLNKLHEWVEWHYNTHCGRGVETDDMVASYWYHLSKELGEDNVCIVSIDKDYKQFNALIYNYSYNNKGWTKITKHEALYNFYTQMITGDAGDNVNYTSGYGKAYAKKLLKDCATKYQFVKLTYSLFRKIYKSKARMKYIQCYHLLKLRTNEHIKKGR